MHQNDIEPSIKPCDLSQYRPGLIFDADGVCLFGKYSDELSAWRAKKKWVEVLHDYFLLEPERDYEISILSDLETLTFCVSCSFTSACGRYAFWRLINHQAPEAENELGGTVLSNSSSSTRYSNGLESAPKDWLIAPLGEASSMNTESSQLLYKILKLFK